MKTGGSVVDPLHYGVPGDSQVGPVRSSGPVGLNNLYFFHINNIMANNEQFTPGLSLTHVQ